MDVLELILTMRDGSFLGSIEFLDLNGPIKNLDIVGTVHDKLFPFKNQYRTNMWENSDIISDDLRSIFLKELDGHDDRLFPTYQFWSDTNMAFKMWSETIQDYIIYDIDLLSKTYSLIVNITKNTSLFRHKGEVMSRDMLERISSCEREMEKSVDSDSDISLYNDFIPSDTEDEWSNDFDSDEE